ncbi:hypothetical protein [Raoultella ornithinolytica]|uniref:hypothetical protein n=1 Tax=Raoultella ornithinolytica TaxID=54291 RepID=UPI0008F5CBD5|nr:hypothetical protein [Raoultella ornithinolytica]APB06677.1 hypothetical protein BK817_17410 [Raoultella ornithinolytica]
MKAVDILKGLQARNISFRLLQGELKHFGLRSARGWSDLINEYTQLSNPNDVTTLNTIYYNLLNFSNRAIFFALPSSKSNNQAIINSLSNTINKNNYDYKEYIQSYPLPISVSNHSKVKKLRPVSIYVKDETNSIALTTTYLRPFKERSIIDPTIMSTSTQNDLQNFDEIIGVKDRYIQCFDTITFNKLSGLITFEIDMCTMLNFEELDRAATKYRRMLSILCFKNSGANILFNRVNLFPAIDKLYNSHDGTVLKLGHATKTGSVKEEKMRKKKDDLRQEKYHAAGLAAIGGKTNNYSISKQWDGSHNNTLTVSIPGHFSLISNAIPFINYAIIEGCSTRNDYDLLITKVI